MRIATIAFSEAGVKLAQLLEEGLARQGDEMRVYATSRVAQSLGVADAHSLDSWVTTHFSSADALLFVSAAGIAVRAVAPHVRDKYKDPAVVCIDEAGTFAIPLLSGHVGGANDLARRIGTLSGAEPAVTTASDVRGAFALDVWARDQDLRILDRSVATRVASALAAGQPVGFVSDFAVEGALPQGLVPASSQAIGVSVSLDPNVRPFERTLRLVPRAVTCGIGCRRNTSAEEIARAVDACLSDAMIAPEALRAIATIDLKAQEQGLLAFCRMRGLCLESHTADELRRLPGTFASSAFVEQTVGVDNVCERAACAHGERLIAGKRIEGHVTCALGCAPVTLRFPTRPARGSLACVGLGPGAGLDLTARAARALRAADLIVGYKTYVDLVRPSFPLKECRAYPMRSEVDRCRAALAEAEHGRKVALVCSGDPGIYGMAGIALELAPDYDVDIEVVAGVTAASAGAALLGAPLMTDWCSISLSDLMCDWSDIERRLDAASCTDFAICLYNPASRGRPDHLRRAVEVVARHRGPATVCGIARNVGRPGEETRVMTLAELAHAAADMGCVVFIGTEATSVHDGRIVTPRGYELKGGR